MDEFARDHHNCFGCSQANPGGLQLRFVRESDDEVSCQFTLGREHESYPGMVHGGIAATVLDEVMGNALAICRRRLCVTLSLRTRFVGPLRTGHAYRARAGVAPGSGDVPVFRVASEITDLEGIVMVTGTGTYQAISSEQASTNSPDPQTTKLG